MSTIGTIYFAYPIDLADGDIGLLADVVDARARLLKAGFSIYEPGRAHHVPPDTIPDATLQSINNEALRLCSAVLALFPSHIRTVGVPMECERAAQMGLPVMVVRDHLSWALAGMHTNIHQFTEVAPAIDALVAHAALVQSQPKIAFPEIYQPPPQIGVFQKLYDPALAPSKAYPDDAGWDLYFNPSKANIAGVSILPGEMAELEAGVAIQWPEGFWGFLIGRSSTFKDLGLVVNPGIIDPGFRGGLCALVRNISNKAVRVSVGDRIAQIIPIPAYNFPMLQVDALAPSERGTNGWGSSGR